MKKSQMIHGFFVVAFKLWHKFTSLDFFRGKIRALHVIRDKEASRPKVLNFPLIQAEKCPSHQECKRACRKFSNFFGMQLCLEGTSSWKLKKVIWKVRQEKKGEKKYLQPLLMTIRVICSLLLFPEKGHNFHQTRKRDIMEWPTFVVLVVQLGIRLLLYQKW